MRTLKDFLEVYEPKAPDEKKFKDKHVTIKFKDRNEVGGKENGDDVFNASNVKTVARKDNRQGYNVGEDEKVYEEADIESMDESELLEFALDLIEKTLTPAEKKKREEIAKAIERDNPDMPMAQKMAIATAQAKKVAEEVNPAHYDIAGLIKKAKAKGDPKHPAMKHVAAIEDIKQNGGALSVQGGHVRSLIKALGEEAEQIDETAKIVAHLQKRYGDNIRKSHVMSAANDFGVDASKLAKAVRTKLGKNMLDEENDEGWYSHKEMYGKVSREHWKKGWRYNNLKDKPFYHQPTKTWHASIKEEVDQIDELSKATLGSYVKKATNQAFNKGFAGGANLSRGQEHEKEGERQVNKAVKRVIGVNKAVNKMTGESVDDVPFKGPYSKPGPSKDQYGNTIKNVPRHLARKAMKALTKEDIIDRAVSKYVPEELKYTPEERMIKRLEGLREDHIDVLMGLFESLNDVNQSKMIESAETEEGRNQLLDFAINNRGA